MPPKKTKAAASKEEEPATNGDHSLSTTSKTATKRKDPPTASSTPYKSQRRSGRKTSTPSSAAKPQLLRYLLSPAARNLSVHADEASAAKEGRRVYSTTNTLTPFEELLGSVVLSRPISHVLGARAIRTLLSAPHSLTTPAAVRAAGQAGLHAALVDARTQHKAKTASQLLKLADVVAEKFGGDLDCVRKDCGHDVAELRALLKSEIKGIGDTGLDIFFRRVQAAWPELYPFVDKRTLAALEEFGLVSSAEELNSLLDQRWKELGETLGVVEGRYAEEDKRKVFVTVLERAVGCHLEGKMDEAKEEAGKL